MNGITRSKIIELCNKNKIPVFEKNFSLVDVYDADEAFVTGTLGSITRVTSIDKRIVEDKSKLGIINKLQSLYIDLILNV